MERFPNLRARGATADTARGPQIADGMFEVLCGLQSPLVPQPATAMVWSPGPFPAPELWAFRWFKPADEDPPTGKVSWQQLHDPARSPPHDTMWIDKIGEASEFQSPHPLDSQETADLFAAHCSARWKSKYHPFEDDPVNWYVVLARPFNAPTGNQAVKIKGGRRYAVSQKTPEGPDVRTAWVWIPGASAGRELWLHYRPQEVGGFRVVGAPTQGVAVSSTRMTFLDRTPAGSSGSWPWTMNNFLPAFIEFALGDEEAPTSDPNDLVLIDYRVGNYL